MQSDLWFYTEGRKVYSLDVMITNGKYKVGNRKKLYITAKYINFAKTIASNLNLNRGIANERNADGSIDTLISK